MPEEKTLAPLPPIVPTSSAEMKVGKKGVSGSIKKFLLIFLALLLISVIGFVAFKSFFSLKESSKEVTLTYWGLWEQESVMKVVLESWEKDHPNVKIYYLYNSANEYRERLQSALARGGGPDIFRFHLTWTPMLKNDLSPLPSSVMSVSEFESAFYPVAATHLRSGNSFLGLPLMADTLALYYNEDIFKAAGKNPPTSWDDLRQLAVDLTFRDANGLIQTAGAALGTTNNVDHWSDILGLMMLQNGADLANPASCNLTAEKEVCLGSDALTFYTIFNRVDHVWDETLPASTLAFASGKLAMYFGPSWRALEIKAINPQLKFKVKPVPQLPGGNVNWASFWVEGVSKQSQYQKEAWEFLQFLANEENLAQLYQAAFQTRPFGEPYPRQKMASLLADDPLVGPFIKQMPEAESWYLCSRTFDNGLNDRMIKYFEDAVNAVNAGQEAKIALQTTTIGITQLLSQYGLTGVSGR